MLLLVLVVMSLNLRALYVGYMLLKLMGRIIGVQKVCRGLDSTVNELIRGTRSRDDTQIRAGEHRTPDSNWVYKHHCSGRTHLFSNAADSLDDLHSDQLLSTTHVILPLLP